MLLALPLIKRPPPAWTSEPHEFTAAPFNLALDSSRKFLYVLSDQACAGARVDPMNCPPVTEIHNLQINRDGPLPETPGSPRIIAPSLVPDHAKGSIVL